MGNQPQFVLECVKAVLEIAKHPICICSYWSTTIVAVVVGFCFVYDWHEELEVVRIQYFILSQAACFNE